MCGCGLQAPFGCRPHLRPLNQMMVGVPHHTNTLQLCLAQEISPFCGFWDYLLRKWSSDPRTLLPYLSLILLSNLFWDQSLSFYIYMKCYRFFFLSRLPAQVSMINERKIYIKNDIYTISECHLGPAVNLRISGRPVMSAFFLKSNVEKTLTNIFQLFS